MKNEVGVVEAQMSANKIKGCFLIMEFRLINYLPLYKSCFSRSQAQRRLRRQGPLDLGRDVGSLRLHGGRLRRMPLPLSKMQVRN
jgi:hypothetical protein